MVDGAPANTAAVADPGFAVGSDAGEERQLPIAAVGLRPVAFSDHLKTPQICSAAGRGDAVGIAIGIHAGQQVGAAGAIGERVRHLRESVIRDKQRKAQQRAFQGIAHGVSRESGWLKHCALRRWEQEGIGLNALLYYNIGKSLTRDSYD